MQPLMCIMRSDLSELPDTRMLLRSRVYCVLPSARLCLGTFSRQGPHCTGSSRVNRLRVQPCPHLSAVHSISAFQTLGLSPPSPPRGCLRLFNHLNAATGRHLKAVRLRSKTCRTASAMIGADHDTAIPRPLRRDRARVACWRCHKKKIRCNSSNTGPCFGCARTSIECVPIDSQRGRYVYHIGAYRCLLTWTDMRESLENPTHVVAPSQWFKPTRMERLTLPLTPPQPTIVLQMVPSTVPRNLITTFCKQHVHPHPELRLICPQEVQHGHPNQASRQWTAVQGCQSPLKCSTHK